MEKITKEQFFSQISYLKECETSIKKINEKYQYKANESCFGDFIDSDETYTSFYHQWQHPKEINPYWHLDIYFYDNRDAIHLRANTPEELWDQYEKI